MIFLSELGGSIRIKNLILADNDLVGHYDCGRFKGYVCPNNYRSNLI